MSGERKNTWKVSCSTHLTVLQQWMPIVTDNYFITFNLARKLADKRMTLFGNKQTHSNCLEKTQNIHLNKQEVPKRNKNTGPVVNGIHLSSLFMLKKRGCHGQLRTYIPKQNKCFAFIFRKMFADYGRFF